MVYVIRNLTNISATRQKVLNLISAKSTNANSLNSGQTQDINTPFPPGKNSEENGEIQKKVSDSIIEAVSFFRKNLPSEEIGLIDPENILNLDYPIFLIINNSLLRTSILDIFHNMNEELKIK